MYSYLLLYEVTGIFSNISEPVKWFSADSLFHLIFVTIKVPYYHIMCTIRLRSLFLYEITRICNVHSDFRFSYFSFFNFFTLVSIIPLQFTYTSVNFIFVFYYSYILKHIYMKRQYMGSNGSVALTTGFISLLFYQKFINKLKKTKYKYKQYVLKE